MIHMTYGGHHKFSKEEIRRLELVVARGMMESGDSGRSASGITAVMAIAWCRRHGYGFVLTEVPGGGWNVKRGEKP